MVNIKDVPLEETTPRRISTFLFRELDTGVSKELVQRRVIRKKNVTTSDVPLGGATWEKSSTFV
jgi:hypothetical protein